MVIYKTGILRQLTESRRFSLLPSGFTQVAQVEIISEKEIRHGWEFNINVLDGDGALTSHILRLAWADYNLWSSDGSDAPAAVADAVMSYFLSKTSADEVPVRFDASSLRRRFPDVDAVIPTLIGR